MPPERGAPTRRRVLTRLALSVGGLVGFSSYAFGVEPMSAPIIARHTLTLPGWPADAPALTLALVADIHAVEPWMSVRRVESIVATTNALGADMILLLGDFVSAIRFRRRLIMPEAWSPALAALRAPLGVHAVLGNHDHRWFQGVGRVRAALESAGVGVLVNDAVRIAIGGHRFWLAGADSIYSRRRPGAPAGLLGGGDDLAATLARVTDDAPIVLMAHEPEQFERVPARVALTVSGHTHGGQIYLPLIGTPAWRDPYVHGVYVEADGRHLVVSAGLGCSGVPMRVLVPPELVLLTLRGAGAANGRA